MEDSSRLMEKQVPFTGRDRIFWKGGPVIADVDTTRG